MAESRARTRALSCDQCFFRQRNLCALGIDEPCPTFRPDGPAGLLPPRQPALLNKPPGVSAAAVPQAQVA